MQPSSIRSENVGKFYSTWNPGIIISTSQRALEKTRMIANLIGCEGTHSDANPAG